MFKEIDRHGTWNNKLSLRQIVEYPLVANLKESEYPR